MTKFKGKKKLGRYNYFLNQKFNTYYVIYSSIVSFSYSDLYILISIRYVIKNNIDIHDPYIIMFFPFISIDKKNINIDHNL